MEHVAARARAALALVLALACVLTSHARAAAPASSGRSLQAAHDTTARNDLHLRRAAAEWAQGDVRGAIDDLEAIDPADPTFAEADRAAFLLGQAYLRAGSPRRFRALADTMTRATPRSSYTRWMQFEWLTAPDDGEADTPALPGDSDEFGPDGDALDALSRLRAGHPDSALARIAAAEARGHGSPLLTYLKALALDASRTDGEALLVSLSSTDTSTALGKDLAGAAIIRRATRMLSRGEDARAVLESVPAGSRYASRARHMLGLSALERGDVERGRRVLAELLTDDSTYAGRRDVALALAAVAVDSSRWLDATQAYEGIDRDWTLRRDALQALLARGSFDSLWAAWPKDPATSDAFVLDGDRLALLADSLATASLTLSARPSVDVPSLAAIAADHRASAGVPPPPRDAWAAVARSARLASEASYDLAGTRWAIAREHERLEARRRYVGIGLARVRDEVAILRVRSALLDSLRDSLLSLDMRLAAVRDEAARRIVSRARDLVGEGDGSLLWTGGMRHFHLDGPHRLRPLPVPTGFPAPDRMLLEEEALARAIQAVAARMADQTPALVARSYAQAWRPNLIDRARDLSDRASEMLADALALERSLDSTLVASSTSDTLVALERRAARQARAADSLAATCAALRTRVARAAVERALADLQGERDAIDYGLAASAYGYSVSLIRTDTTRAPTAAGARATPDNAERPDDPESARWRDMAIARARAFLQRHPDSFARGEMRFRLADLLLVEARQRFREDMARYIQTQSEGTRATLPVLSYKAAFDLYTTILKEDPSFPHRDAVLFNAGMILADDGNPDAARFFQDLVTAHPASPYCQEAYLRMGDMSFAGRRFQDGVNWYGHAAEGRDRSLRTIALYKMGWAYYNQERFLDAVDAFRSVLDVYASESTGVLQVDLRHEAESDLIQSMSRAGGAMAFAEYFDRIGPRPYERRSLLALGQYGRRYSLYQDAAAADALYLTRYPLESDALTSAQRLTETYLKSDQAAMAREAQLKFAPMFAPGSAWAKAQASDSARAAGAEFARASWKSVALEHHLAARKTGSRDDWREALRLYDTILAHWPDDADAANLHLDAGEASARLGEYPAALEHYAAAARSGPDSVAAQAMWQQVAVTDAWYESTRTAHGGAAATGTDSLAHAVIDAADRLLARFPDHPKSADLMWREGNLALAHGWVERSTADFGRLVARHPNDPRASMAAALRADALFRAGKFADAGAAYEEALAAAQRAGADSLARRAARAIPICYYRDAEAAVAADSTDYARHAELFEKVASRWPAYEHADLAQYRAGLAYLRAGQTNHSVRAMQGLILQYPKSPYVKDATLQIAKAWEASGDKAKAGQAYVDFTTRYPQDESAGDAWLKGADLFDAAGLTQRADELKLAYIHAHPNDVQAAMEILEGMARRELKQVGPGHPISTLFAPPAPAKARTSKKKAAPAPLPAPRSRLEEYLRLGQKHPDLASRDLVAQVRFLQGEESFTAYKALRLTLPLEKSIKAKQALLDGLLADYKKSVDLAVPEWVNASTFRIGEALIAFGEALEQSDKPADLKGNDLQGYEDVLQEQSRTFHDRGEGVWTELLRQKGRSAGDDPWIAKAQSSLWSRLGSRFYFRPEAEFPLLAAKPAERVRPEKDKAEGEPAPHRSHAKQKNKRAPKEG